MNKIADELYLQATAAADAHGASSDDPDHEIGDLQVALAMTLKHVGRESLDSLRRDLQSHGLLPTADPE